MPHPTCSPSPDSPPPGPLRPGELVSILADRLAEAHAEGALAGAAVVRARPTRSGVDLAVLPLPDGVHPADALLGTEVPRRWNVAGVVAHGAAVDLGSGGRTPVAVALLVDRAGRVAHRVLAADPGGEAELPALDHPPTGRLSDLLHRSLGLPTPPPGEPSGRWWATLWLDRIVAEAAEEPGRPRTLLELGALHPLVGPRLPPRAACVLHRITPSSSVAGWDVMRRAAADLDVPVVERGAERVLHDALRPFVTPELARWHDRGSFSRALVGALPPRSALLAAVDALLAPRLARALRTAVGEPPPAPRGHR